MDLFVVVQIAAEVGDQGSAVGKALAYHAAAVPRVPFAVQMGSTIAVDGMKMLKKRCCKG